MINKNDRFPFQIISSTEKEKYYYDENSNVFLCGKQCYFMNEYTLKFNSFYINTYIFNNKLRPDVIFEHSIS